MNKSHATTIFYRTTSTKNARISRHCELVTHMHAYMHFLCKNAKKERR